MITATEQAESEGKNRFQTATIDTEAIRNHSRYEGRSYGIGISGSMGGGEGRQQIGGQKLTAYGDNTVTRTDNGDTVRRGRASVSAQMGFGRDSDSRESTTPSGIGTRNLTVTADPAAAATLYTDIRTETAAVSSGRLNNTFDKERVQKELDIQREVTQQFGQNAAQGIATVSDYLGNTQNFERAEMMKAAVEAELAVNPDQQQRTRLQEALQGIEDYLSANRKAYNLWKEGGAGRSLLHAGAGGLLTGSLGGAAASGGTSLAAPYLDKAGERLGSGGKAVVDTLGGAAVGFAVGGNTAAAIAGWNTDRFNRQLHPSEYATAKRYSEQIAAELSKREKRRVTKEEAEARIIRQMLRNVDEATAKADLFKRDDNIVSLMGAYLPKRDKHYQDSAYNSRYNAAYRPALDHASRYKHFGRTPEEINSYNRHVVTDIPKAIVNVGIGAYESAANLANGSMFTEDPAYARIGRIGYGIPEYGNALETAGSLGLGAYALGRGVKTGSDNLRSKKFGIWKVDELKKTAKMLDRSNLTVAGRALQKHGNREGSAFPRAKGSPSLINLQAEKIVSDILHNPKTVATQRNTGRFGKVTDVVAPDGRGLRYDSTGKFIGFLEPKK